MERDEKLFIEAVYHVDFDGVGTITSDFNEGRFSFSTGETMADDFLGRIPNRNNSAGGHDVELVPRDDGKACIGGKRNVRTRIRGDNEPLIIRRAERVRRISDPIAKQNDVVGSKDRWILHIQRGHATGERVRDNRRRRRFVERHSRGGKIRIAGCAQIQDFRSAGPGRDGDVTQIRADGSAAGRKANGFLDVWIPRGRVNVRSGEEETNGDDGESQNAKGIRSGIADAVIFHGFKNVKMLLGQ
jgi:hypothetical protein